jgi:hypothetical protein
MWFPGSVVLGNVIPDNTQPWTFPVGNSYPANWAAVGMMDLAGGNYRLAPTSPYIVAGTGGTTPGADLDALEAALSGGAPTIPVCTFAVTPLSHSSPSSGDSFSVGVTASAPSCAWSASPAAWVAASAAGGTGSGTVVLTVAQNATTTQRQAQVMVAGKAVTITQAAPVVAPVCAFTLSPSSVKVLAGGTTFAATLTATAPSCAWTARASAAWIGVSSTSGAGTATLSVRVAATTSNGPRTATITAGGQTLTVQQNGRKKK